MGRCDLSDLELGSCRLDAADLRGGRSRHRKAPTADLYGVTVGEDQLPTLSRLAVEA